MSTKMSNILWKGKALLHLLWRDILQHLTQFKNACMIDLAFPTLRIYSTNILAHVRRDVCICNMNTETLLGEKNDQK